MANLIVRQWQGKTIRQRADGLVSLTDMCQASGKSFGHWNALKTTAEYLEVVRNRYYRDSDSSPIEVNEGNLGERGGTWGDRRVALRLAQWISPEFALQVDEWVEELMTTGTVSIAPKPFDMSTLAPPIERVASLQSSLKFFGIDVDNPRFKQGIQDLVGDTLGLTPSIAPSLEIWLGVAERAEQLGISTGLVTRHRSQLGKAVKAQMSPEDQRYEKRLCNGTQRDINLYRLNPTLDAAIESFFAIKAVV